MSAVSKTGFTLTAHTEDSIAKTTSDYYLTYIALVEPKIYMETIMFTATQNSYIRSNYPSDGTDS